MFIDFGDRRKPHAVWRSGLNLDGTCLPEFRSSKRRGNGWACRSINISPLRGWQLTPDGVATRFSLTSQRLEGQSQQLSKGSRW